MIDESSIGEINPEDGLSMLPFDLFGLLNRPGGETDIIREILMRIKRYTGFEAVGIRLKGGDDYPYYETSGFSESFVEAENYLCVRNPNGNLQRDEDGRPVLECMCGNVIHGNIDPSLPFFTSGGSFWTNSTTELLASTTEEERQGRTRNRCNDEGYESLGLIPLKSAGQTMGLLQLNDSRTGLFSIDMVLFLERIASSIGIALTRKEHEEALYRANMELDSFAHTVSHDLKAPIVSISTANHTLRDLLRGPETEKSKKYVEEALDMIDKGVSRSNALIDDLLALARAGRTPEEVSDVDVGDAVRSVLRERREDIEARGVTVIVDGDLGSVVASPIHIYELFSNLIGNAIKHNDSEDPCIEVLSLGDGGGNVHRYLVRDNGSGIPEDVTERVFLPFFKGSTTGETGVGLATVRKIVDLYRGDIQVYNDDGACFEVFINDLS